MLYLYLHTRQNSVGPLRLRLAHFLHFKARFVSRMEWTDGRGRGRVGLSDHFKMWPFSSIVRLEFGRPTDQAGQSTSAPTNIQPEHSISRMGLDEGFELLTHV